MQETSNRRIFRMRYAARAGVAIVSQPYEGVERTVERAAEWHDWHRRRWSYAPDPDPEARLHGLIGAPWPCSSDGFEEVWAAGLDELRARGLEVGRGAFGGWDDGDARLARFAWCVTRHLRPRRVVETGVARGLTTRVLLEALERNGEGQLWSIDLPPLIERSLEQETGAAVPDRLRGRWTLLRGSSRRLLPALLARLGTIDLFVHDSMHTTRNLAFELAHAWLALAPGGAVLIDDVEKNRATGRFVQENPGTPCVICAAEDRAVLIGALVKPADRRGP